MLKATSVSRQRSRGLWCKKLDKALRSGILPNHRQPLPTDVMRIVVDMLIREDRTSAYVLGQVSKSFRVWVLQILYEVVVFTSPAHVEQVRTLSTLGGSLTMHVHHLSLVGLEMHIYGELNREGGLYKTLEGLTSACVNLETILYDFKRVPLPFALQAPRSLTQAHWSHPSHDGWLGYESSLQHVTHLRVDCAQNDTRNAALFDTLLSSSVSRNFPNLTHLCFGIDVHPRHMGRGTQRTVDFVRAILLQRPELARIVIMLWHYDPLRSNVLGLLGLHSELKNPRVCFFLSCGAPDEVSSVKDWEDVTREGSDVWCKAARLLLRLQERGMKVDAGRELIIGSMVYPTIQPLPHVEGYLNVT